MRILPVSVRKGYQNLKQIATSPETIADIITKGKFSALQEIATVAGRPDIPHAHMLEAGVQLPPIYSYAYLRGIEKKVAVLRSVDLKLKQEIFRNGGAWQPRFVQKCSDDNCGEELQESVEECPRCKGTDFLMPSTMGKDDFEKVVKRANINGQTLLKVFAEIEEDLNTGDDAYLVTPKRILLDTGEGRPMLWPTEVFRGDPDLFRKVTDRKGIPGGKYWKCLRCKGEDGQPFIHTEPDRAKAKAKRCDKGHELYEVFYVATDYQGTEPRYYYIEGEVEHVSKYSPSLLYGFSPVITLFNEALSLFHTDRRIRMRMEKGRAEGIILIPTKNPESLEKAKKRMAEEKAADESYLAMMATDPNAKHQPTFLQLLGTIADNQVLDIKQNFKETIGSLYGVSLIFQADTSVSGGLNNEGLQIKVTDRAVENGQRIYNEELLPHLMKQYGVIDMIWLLNPNEEQDMAADEDLRSKRISNATAMLGLGYVSELKDNGEFDFEYDPDSAMELRGVGGGLMPPIDTGEELLPPTKPIDLKRSMKKQGCPQGQHEHGGISGCHPSDRQHREKKPTPTTERKPTGQPETATDISQATKNMEEFKTKVPKEQLESLGEYTDGAFLNSNEFLRTGNVFSIPQGSTEDKAKNKAKEDIEKTSKFLNDAPKIEGKVFRGMGFGDEDEFNEFTSNLKKGENLNLKAFTSATVSEKVATDFLGGEENRILFEMDSSNGVFLDGASLNPDEDEVLFDKDSNFEISDINIVQDDEGPITRVLLREV